MAKRLASKGKGAGKRKEAAKDDDAAADLEGQLMVATNGLLCNAFSCISLLLFWLFFFVAECWSNELLSSERQSRH